MGKAVDAQEAGAEGGALLVERGGLVCGLVEEGVVCDGGVDVETRAGDDGLFAACDGSHEGKRKGWWLQSTTAALQPFFTLRFRKHP